MLHHMKNHLVINHNDITILHGNQINFGGVGGIMVK